LKLTRGATVFNRKNKPTRKGKKTPPPWVGGRYLCGREKRMFEKRVVKLEKRKGVPADFGKEKNENDGPWGAAEKFILPPSPGGEKKKKRTRGFLGKKRQEGQKKPEPKK